MSMAHSLEARVPYLDTEVASFAMALPTSAKVRGWAKKRILRKAAEPLVPKAIATGRKKGFSIPAAAWLRGPLVPVRARGAGAGARRRAGPARPGHGHVRARSACSRT